MLTQAPKPITTFWQLATRNGLLGVSVLIGSVLSFGKAKVISVFGGPADLAVFGVFTGLIAFLSAASSIGLTSSAVQKISRTDAADVDQRLSIFRDAIRIALAGVMVVCGFIFGSWFVGATVLNAELSAFDQVLILAVAVVATVSSDMLLVWFRSSQDIPRIALHGAIGALVSFGLTFAYYRGALPRPAEVAAASLGFGGALAALGLGYRLVWRTARGLFERFEHAKGLLVFGSTVYVSRLFDTARSFLTPLLLVYAFTAESAGMVQAASRLSLALVGLLLTGAAKEFYPRVSSVAGDEVMVRQTIDRQLIFLVLLYSPVAVVSLILTDFMVTTLFSDAFLAASPLFQLHVLGDLPRIAAWILGFTCLGAGGSRYYSIAEITTHSAFMVILVGTSFIAGLYSEPIAYIAAGCLQLVLYAVWVHRRYRYRPSRTAVAASALYVAVWALIVGVQWTQ